MLALSIRQPWASLILKAGKNIENRDWPTKYRGRILVHAAKGMTRAEHEDAIGFAVEAIKADPRNADAAKKVTLRELGFAFEASQRQVDRRFADTWEAQMTSKRVLPYYVMRGPDGKLYVLDTVKK